MRADLASLRIAAGGIVERRFAKNYRGHPDPHHDPHAATGAVDFEECPRRVCKCEPCAVCGHAKHVSLHGPFFGEKPGSRPWGHRYVPRRGEK